MKLFCRVTLVLLWLFTLQFWSCDGKEPPLDDGIVVQFKDNYLTKSQLSFYIPNGIPEADSARYAQQFIAQWIKERAVMERALTEDHELTDLIDYKVRDYRAKLIMHEYESKLVERSLDKDISDSSIQKFYDDNIEHFKSKEDLYCYFYLVTKENSLAQVDKWMGSSKESDLESLRNWASANSLEAKFDSSYEKSTVISQLSKGYYGNLRKVRAGQLVQWTGVIQGERFKYRFKLIDVVRTGDYLPVSLCEERIKNSLLNDRRIKLIEDTENKIVKDAQAQNYIQY